MAGEYLTPIFPNYFLLLAAISNFGKAVIITAFVSTAPSLSIVFAKSHTVCDITAKTQVDFVLHLILSLLDFRLNTAWLILQPLQLLHH